MSTRLPMAPRTAAAERRAWYGVGLLVLVILSMWWVSRAPLVHVAQGHWPSDVPQPFRVVSLAYGEIVPQPDGVHLTAVRFAHQLELLRAIGFVPIRLADLVGAYEKHATLPAKSLLVTFSGGYRNTLHTVEPQLCAWQIPGVFFVDTAPMAARDTRFVSWHDLRRLRDAGVWELGLEGGPFAAQEALLRSQLGNITVLADSGSDTDAASPPLHFDNDWLGVSNAATPARHLRRLHVHPAIPDETLVERVNATFLDLGPVWHTPTWVGGTGITWPEDDDVVLGPHSTVWLAGTQWADAWELTADVWGTGHFWISQGSADGTQQWRVGAHADGVFVQHRQADGIHTLANDPRSEPLLHRHTLHLVRRGPGLWVEWDSRPVLGTPYRFPEAWDGPVGVGTAPTADVESNHVALRLHRLHTRRLPYRWHVVASIPHVADLQPLRDDPGIAAISPRWALDATSATLTAQRELVSMAAAHYALDILPTIALQDADVQTALWARLAQQAQAAQWAGVVLECDRLSHDGRARWQEQAGRAAKEFVQRRLRLVGCDAGEAKVL